MLTLATVLKCKYHIDTMVKGNMNLIRHSIWFNICNTKQIEKYILSTTQRWQKFEDVQLTKSWSSSVKRCVCVLACVLYTSPQHFRWHLCQVGGGPAKSISQVMVGRLAACVQRWRIMLPHHCALHFRVPPLPLFVSLGCVPLPSLS